MLAFRPHFHGHRSNRRLSHELKHDGETYQSSYGSSIRPRNGPASFRVKCFRVTGIGVPTVPARHFHLHWRLCLP
jgi:hypothetical protein